MRVLLLERVDNNTRAQLRLKPSSLGRHDIAGVGNVDKLLHRYGVQCEGNLHLAAIYALLQLAQTADTTYEVDTLKYYAERD